MNSKNVIATILPVLGLLAGTTANATLVNYSTGASVIGGVDQSWKVVTGSAVSSAYLVDSTQWPIAGGPWIADSKDSSWIMSSPTLLQNDPNGHSDFYQLSFYTSGASGLTVNWSSDNSSTLFLGSTQISQASEEDSFLRWHTATLPTLTAGNYTLSLDVYNSPQATGNPSGARVEFFAPVVVPEPSTIIAGALLALPFGVSAIRSFRRAR